LGGTFWDTNSLGVLFSMQFGSTFRLSRKRHPFGDVHSFKAVVEI
jgi:hypothetical protein